MGEVTWEWVKGKYVGEQAKWVSMMANTGIYFILESGKEAGSPYVIAVLKWVHKNGPVPHHLANLTSFELDKVKKWEERK